MSLFFTFSAGPKALFYRRDPIVSKWHPSLPVVAVAVLDFESKDDKKGTSKVSVFTEEGERQSGCELETVVQTMAWHPKHKTLAIALRDGSIVVLHENDKKEVASPHKGRPVHVLSWNTKGDRLLSADDGGFWCVYKYDQHRHTLSQTSSNKDALEGTISHCVFRTKHERPALRGADEDDEDKQGQRLTVEDEDEPPDFSHHSGGPVTRFNENCTWFIAGSAGNVWGVDEDGKCGMVFATDNSPVVSLLYYARKTGLIVLNQNLGVSYYTMQEDHRWTQVSKFKLSLTKGAVTYSISMSWAGTGLIATVACEAIIRMWNVDENENYIIKVPDTGKVVQKVATTSYNAQKQTLAVGTLAGKVMVWQYTGPELNSDSEKDWSLSAEIQLDDPVRELEWGPGDMLLSAGQCDCTMLLNGTSIKRKLAKHLVVVQLTHDTLHYEDLSMKTTHSCRARMRVKGLDVAGSHVAVWNTEEIQLFHLQMSGATSVGSLNIANTGCALHPEKLLVARSERGLSSIEIYNIQLQKLSNLSIKAHEGDATRITVAGDFLAAATSKNYLNCWWIGGRSGENRSHGYPKQLWDSDNMTISHIALNSSGGMVAVLGKEILTGGAMVPLTKLYVCDLEHDRVMTYDLADMNRTPESVMWDETEKKLLAVETKVLKKDVRAEETGDSQTDIVMLFASEKGLHFQDKVPLGDYTALVGLSVPNFYFYKREASITPDGRTHVHTKVMRDFDGIDCSDHRVKDALLDFSYNLACGDMDAAYRSVKLIKDETVWTNMAQMCVKTGRLDVAEVCLGNMQDAKGARALREAKKEPEAEAHLAMLALQLGLLDEAERLYKKCGRYDLLNVMHTACGRWNDAIELAKEHDRIHLRSIRYQYARHLEILGETEKAIAEYEKANCHGYEVPRMLYDAGKLDELEAYANNSSDKNVYLWWAQFCESNGQYEQALAFYKEAGDVFSRCRLLCFLKEFSAAEALVNENLKDCSAAAYHLATHFEDAAKKIQYFRMAKAYKNAIRIARANDMDGEVMQLSLQADQNTIIESAQWFEEQGMLPKAVILYKKGGELSKAIDLCVRGELFDTLQQLADELGGDTDADVYLQCAEFFMSKEQYEKAVSIYIQAKGYSEALQVCLDHNVKLTEEMAEEMTLPKTEDEDDEATRLSLLRKIAKVAKIQESWHLSCKKYTQAGDKVKGMKALLKSGDTDKIIFFTNHSRQKDIYILAAHYLQTCDWHTNKGMTNHIINFYTKARAYESLSGFYDAIAQVHIDEFRDYDKALEALQDAAKYMEKSKATNREEKMRQLETKYNYVKQFVEARNMVKTDPNRMVEMCKELLEMEDIENAVRVGDVYALLVEFYTGHSEFEKAYHLIEQMTERQIILSYYLEASLVQAVCNAMGVEYKEQEQQQAGGAAAAAAAEDEVPDEIVEEDEGGGFVEEPVEED